MFRFVLCLVFIIFRVEASVPETENPVIRLSYSHDDNKKYVVWKDKPLKIIIEDGPTRYIWCHNFYRTSEDGRIETFLPETKFTNGYIQILNITHVTAEMSTRWACTALEKYYGPVKYMYKNKIYTASNLHFNLHVKGARTVNLIANGISLTYETTNLSVYYDGEANYSYGDGEDTPIYFECDTKNNKIRHDLYSEQNKDTLRLEYYNAEGILLFASKPQDSQIPIFFHSVLKSNNHKFYFDCILVDREIPQEYRYRTTFYKRDLHVVSLQHAVILTINGQKISTFYNNSQSYDNYIFKYIDGEILTIECRKIDVNTRGSLMLYAEGITNQILRVARPSEAVISLNISTLDININLSRHLTCGINDTVFGTPKARLLLLSDVPGNDVRIHGLPRNNILYQYTNGEAQWTIEYQYSVNNTVNLTCVWHEIYTISRPFKKSFLWKLEDTTLYSEAIDMPRTGQDRYKLIRFSEIPLIMTLNASHNGTKIQCMYRDDFNSAKATVEIILRLKPTLLSEENQIVSEQNIIISGKKSTNSYTLVYCLTAAGVGVIILLIISYWCCNRSSSEGIPPVATTRPHSDTVFYENLLSVFRPINEREAAELENHYEVIE